MTSDDRMREHGESGAARAAAASTFPASFLQRDSYSSEGDDAWRAMIVASGTPSATATIPHDGTWIDVGAQLRRSDAARLHVGDVLVLDPAGPCAFGEQHRGRLYMVEGRERSCGHLVCRDEDGRLRDVGGAAIFASELPMYRLVARGSGPRISAYPPLTASDYRARMAMAGRANIWRENLARIRAEMTNETPRAALASGFPFTFTPEQAS